jgi:Ca2+-transporting ATPase
MAPRSSKEAPRIDGHEWHAHEASEVVHVLGTSEEGLTNDEVVRRRNLYGQNAFTHIREPGAFLRVARQVRSPLAFVLVAAGVVTLALHEYVDAAVIGFALAIAMIVGVLQEGKASRAFRTLRDSQTHTATVRRSGALHEINAADLVPGDVVVIESGMQIPADIRIMFAKGLAVSEAALTGESMPVQKAVAAVPVGAAVADRTSMGFLGTFVVSGYGEGVVVAVGDQTEVGKIAHTLATTEDTRTPLQVEMARIARIMLYVIVGLTLGVFALGLYEGQPIGEMLLIAIAIAVASVPEGLPAAVTIVLAIGMESLLRRGGLVRNLLTAETLGSTTVVMTDKTGTLTEGIMAVTGVIHAAHTNRAPHSWHTDTTVRMIFDTALVATSAYREVEGETERFHGDPVERAVLEAAIEIGIDPDATSLRAHRTDHLAFESEHRFAAGLVPRRDTMRLVVNGAPEILLAAATKLHGEDGVRSLTLKDRERLSASITAETKEGRRLVAVAYRDVSFATIPTGEAAAEKVLGGLVFLAILVMNDPVRKRVATAIAGVQSAGARVLLVTGDNRETALSVARATGIAGAHDTALRGDELTDLSDDELVDVARNVSVFARVLPHQKLRIAEVLMKHGEIVAMTGDGVNDAPALRRANIGIAVGSGTEVAKAAADLVLMRDSFEIIYAAIEEGRRIVANLRKIVGYLLATSLSEVVLIAAALLSGAASPLLPAQILWANIIEEGLMSFAFAFEKGERDAMKRRPQDIYEEGILSRAMIRFIAFVLVVHGALITAFYFLLRALAVPAIELSSTMFLMIAIDSLFIAFSFRSLTTPLWRIPLRTNLAFIAAFLASAALLAGALSVPFLRYLLSYEPLPAGDIALVVAYSVGVLAVIEIGKWLFFERRSEVVE